MIEEWRPCLGGGTYEASSLGRIRRIEATRTTPAGHVMSPHTDKTSGYRLIGLRLNGVRKTRLLHRVIADAFLGPCPAGLVVNHIDCDVSNNAPRNLEYVSQAENLAHTKRLGRARHSSKLSAEDVRAIRGRLERGESQADAARAYSVHKTNISCIARRVTWKAS